MMEDDAMMMAMNNIICLDHSAAPAICVLVYVCVCVCVGFRRIASRIEYVGVCFLITCNQNVRDVLYEMRICMRVMVREEC